MYNHKRPHEGIGLSTPIKRYRPSARAFPDTLPTPEYGPDDEVLRVGWNGKLVFRGLKLKVSNALQLMDVAARQNPEKADTFDFYFGHHRFMKLDLNEPTTTR